MSPPPPPPPTLSGEEMQHPQHASIYHTPPQRQTKSYGYGYSYGYMARRRTANAGSLDAPKSPASSSATSASPAASPSHLSKTKSASELVSPRVRARMDPYPRYSPRKRLSADFSDGTCSAGTESPKSEKGGWRIHAAVHGPFLTGPLAKDFVNHKDELLSPRGKKNEEEGFNDTGLLLFPVVPTYVAPAITPEVFQASIQPQAKVEQQPQPEPDLSVAAPLQNDACYYPDSSLSQQPTETPAAEASWDANAQQQQYYQEDHQQYYDGASEGQQYYNADTQQYYQATSEEQQYYQEQQAAYYCNGYDQQQYDAANYGYEQSYEQYPAVSAEQPVSESVAAVEPPSADEFPPLPHHEVAATAAAETTDSVAAEQSAESLPLAPPSPVQRPRAPSYAEIVSGTAQSSPPLSEAEPTTVAISKTEALKAPRKVSFDAFNQLSEGIAESMMHILAKSKDATTSHAEVEFTCAIHRIQTQLKLMGKVTRNLHLEQVKTMHKLQQSEIEKLSIEATNLALQQQIHQYEVEQLELKQQLAVALEAKDQRLKAAVDTLTQRIDALKSLTDASTAKMASDIDALSSAGSEDLEQRVKEIGDVLEYLVKHQTGESSTKALVRQNDSGRQSSGSWKSIALYSLVACAASLSGVWVGINYADDIQHFGTTQPVALEEAAVEAILSQITDDAPASYASQIVEILENEVVVADVADTAVDAVVAAAVSEEVDAVVVEMEVVADLSSAAAVVDFIKVPAVSANWNTEDASVLAPVTSSALVEMADAELAEEVVAVEEAEIAEEEAVVVDVAVEVAPEVVEPAAEVFEALPEVVEVVEPAAEVVEVASEVVEVAAEVVEVAAEVVEVAAEVAEVADEVEKVAAEVDEVAAEVVEDVLPAVAVELAVPQIAMVEAAPRPVAANVCKPFAQALCAWCPSLFDLPTDEKTAQPTGESSSPLSGLARALGSLSSRILTESVPLTADIGDVVAETPVQEEETPEMPFAEETPEAVVEDVEVPSEVVETVEVEEVAAMEVEVEEVAAVEVVEVEKVAMGVEYSNSTARDSFDSPLIEALTFVAPEEPVVAEIAVEAPVFAALAIDEPVVEEGARSRWAQEQFLIEIGALSSLDADVFGVETLEAEAVEVAVVEEVVAESVSSEWFLQEPLEFTEYTNVSAPVFVETEMMEEVDVTESAPESRDEMCSAPVLDFKTQLLTAL